LSGLHLRVPRSYVFTSISHKIYQMTIILQGTGRAMEQYPSFSSCMANAAFSQSNVPAQAGAALALALKVWGGVVSVTKPSSQRVVDIISHDIVVRFFSPSAWRIY
jgi:hypothetical protein